MDPITVLPKLLGAAWLIPLASFALIVFFGPRMGKAGSKASWVATGAILTSCLLSVFALFFVWLPNYKLADAVEHHDTSAAHAEDSHEAADDQHANEDHAESDAQSEEHDDHEHAKGEQHAETVLPTVPGMPNRRSSRSPATGTRWGSSAI